MKKLLVLFSLFILQWTGTAQAAGGYAIELTPAENNLRDQQSLQRGAILFSNYCMACHSAKYMRYNRIARNLGWSDEEVVDKMAHGLNKVVDNVEKRMPDGIALKVLGADAPDLSLMGRLRGSDYVYTFLTGYYEDEKGNWNNHVLTGTAMPNVLEGIKRHSSEEDFQQVARDLTNFIEYIGEPSKVDRWDLAPKVIAFLLVLLLLTYLLKKEYWRDIKKH
ncbi:cytochrome c1 [Thiomicrorhabdus sediminis]|uniref:Cytochrome c1 n=1 Tax=Thiomicrorhabdus sediminis TaxID=2580412 RepID=A0A4P9K5T8_9GAMM|nr:cytochrome c1 [Thiomicrorhabdus sediminis]QCU89627.1 cytochrome c1 [Thiomicrorhabdus sediminis]